jgi:type IV secretion system protein VirD4
MLKKKGLFYTLYYYRIPHLLIFTLLLPFADSLILKAVCKINGITPYSKFYPLIHLFIKCCLIFVWGKITIDVIRSKHYHHVTGRNFDKDTGMYKRNYLELVSYFRDAEPHRLDTSDFPLADWHDINGLIFGKDEDNHLIALPSNSECNIAVFGPPGSGKTSGIAIINAMQFNGSVMAVDIKGDIYNYVSHHSDRKIIRFCPDSPTALQDSCRFNPFEGLSQMDVTTRKLFLDSMATVLIADEGGNESNYFTSRARKMFQGIVHLLYSENPNISFPDVIHAILEGNIFEWVEKAMNSECVPAKEQLSSFYGNSEKNVSSAYDALVTALVSFSNPVLDELLSNTDKCVSIDDLENGYDVYLQISQEHLEAYAPIFTLLIQNFCTAFTRRPDSSTGADNRPILLLLDEFPQLTFSYKLINSNLSTLRSKSVICMLIQQNLSQLEYRYQPTGARSITGNCNYQIILGSNDINSSKVFSDTFGDKKVLKAGNSITVAQNNSTGHSAQEVMERVYPPEVFGDLPSQGKMIIYFKGKYCDVYKLNCYKD